MHSSLTLLQIDSKTAISHLIKAEPHFIPIIRQGAPLRLAQTQNISLFAALLEAIIHQQLTPKAASTVYQRLCANLAGGAPPAPLDMLRATPQNLIDIGLSPNKARAVQSLAEYILSGQIPQKDELEKLANHEIIHIITQVKGIGTWTTEMLLIFYFHRADVFSLKDYALQKGYAIMTGVYPHIPTVQTLEQASLAWRPYRTYAAWYLWRALDIFALQLVKTPSLGKKTA